tara:strand:+ start:305 stop:436 length:132 start_codon:yes stop_codon:yes gene_type:complete
MKAEIFILMLAALGVIVLDPQWAFLIACLVLALILLPIGGLNE